MVLGLGCDIVQVSRFSKWVSKPALQKRYFTQGELQYIENQRSDVAMQRLAGMFSVKESFIKAVNIPVRLVDIVIERNKDGAPRLRLERSALKIFKQRGATYSLVSISHEREYAMATVIIGC